MKIRFVPQRYSSDCGVACIAMIAGVSYQEAFDVIGFPEERTQFYTTHTCLTNALRRLGVLVMRRKFRSWHDIAGLAIVAVNHRRNRRYFHWVIFDGAAIIDPSPKGKLKKNIRYLASGRYLQVVTENI